MARFTFSCDPRSRTGVLKNDKVRITLLTSRLLRLETGAFTDMPTQTVWNRNLDNVSYTTHKAGNLFSVYTSECTFTIDLHKQAMVSVTLTDGSVVTDFEKGNLLGTARTLDMVNGSTRLNKGILSRSGVAMMDDSRSLLLADDGHILPREDCTDQYFFAYGQDFLAALKDFFRLTGSVPLVPKYALGNWWSRYRAYTQEEYRQLMQEFIDRKLPITVATIDMDWHWTDVLERFGKDAAPGPAKTPQELFYNKNLPGWTGYSWNTELFPDYQELLNWLKEQGFHITLNVHPSQGVRYYEDAYKTVCEKMGVDPDSRELISFDVTDLKFLETYFDDLHHPYEADGVDFWWLDWQQGKKTKIPGLDPLWALNHYHTLDAARDDQNPLILSRYAGLGSHRYPVGFSGDTVCSWESLDFQPYFTNNASNAGYTWWSHDIGGHMKGCQDDEMYVRWIQYGVFSPINRLHSSNSEYMGKEPWKRSFAAEKVAADFLRLRHKLIPFLHSANYQTHLDGVPICMPMYYRYPGEEAYQVPNQYIFGSQLLVAPITKPANKQLNLSAVKVWLPEGRWTDIFTDRVYQGGGFVTMHRDLDTIPVLAGEGAIVPMYRNCDSNDLSLAQPLEIHVWQGSGEFTLYDDDGAAAYAATKLQVKKEQDALQFIISAPEGDTGVLPENREMYIRFRDVAAATVTVNGSPAEFSRIGIRVTAGREAVTIQLTNIRSMENPSREALTASLFTRVQWPNSRKEKLFRKENHSKLPGFLKDALAEFYALI